jgi:hypothetical protein
MEKITDKINALPDGANYFSLEFFPPKTAMVSLPRDCTRQEMECGDDFERDHECDNGD